jgi:hypothetical protein
MCVNGAYAGAPCARTNHLFRPLQAQGLQVYEVIDFGGGNVLPAAISFNPRPASALAAAGGGIAGGSSSSSSESSSSSSSSKSTGAAPAPAPPPELDALPFSKLFWLWGFAVLVLLVRNDLVTDDPISTSTQSLVVSQCGGPALTVRDFSLFAHNAGVPYPRQFFSSAGLHGRAPRRDGATAL